MWNYPCLGAGVLILAAFAAPRQEFLVPRPQSLGNYAQVSTTGAQTPQHAGLVEDAEANPHHAASGALTLRQAIALALIHNPELSAYSWELRAKEAAALQAGVWPNPEIEVEIENFGGGAGFSGTKAAETTILLGQLIEWGGKRAKRVRLATFRKELAQWEYETKRLDILTGTAQAFIRVLAAQEDVRLQTELIALSDQVGHTVAARVEAGKVSPLEVTKAQVSLALAQLELDQAEQRLAANRVALAAFWGEPVARFTHVEGALTELEALPPLTELTQTIGANPDVAQGQTKIREGEAELELAQSQRIPDWTVKGGVRRLAEVDTDTFVLGVSIPLPLFNRQRGAIAQAQAQVQKARTEAHGTQVRAASELAQTYRRLQAEHSRASTIETHVLAGAKRAYDGMNEGYREGKFELLDVLDAQRTFFEAKAQYFAALTQCHLLKAEVDRLIGQDIFANGSSAAREGHHE